MKYYKYYNGYLACEDTMNYEEITYEEYQIAIDTIHREAELLFSQTQSSLADEYQTPEDTLI